MSILEGSWGRGFRLVGGESPTDAETLCRTLAKAAKMTLNDLMDEVIDIGLGEVLQDAFQGAMDRAERKEFEEEFGPLESEEDLQAAKLLRKEAAAMQKSQPR